MTLEIVPGHVEPALTVVRELFLECAALFMELGLETRYHPPGT